MNNSKTTSSKSRNPSRRRLAWSHHQSTDLRSNPLISTSQSLQSRQQQLKKPTNPSTEHKSITTPPKPQCVRTSPKESVNYGNNPIWDSVQKWTRQPPPPKKTASKPSTDLSCSYYSEKGGGNWRKTWWKAMAIGLFVYLFTPKDLIFGSWASSKSIPYFPSFTLHKANDR